MGKDLLESYKTLHRNLLGYHEQKRGLIEVSGKEAVQFVNGMITNDVAKLEDGAQMLAAFPNAQGRLLALVRVMRKGNKFLFETEEATREKVFQNLFRFTFAGDFFVEDISEKYQYFEISDPGFQSSHTAFIKFQGGLGASCFIPKEAAEDILSQMKKENAIEIFDELYEVLRIEKGVPLDGIDMDETTIVPEIGLPDLISYNKGCYIGQEIIARIHFRGHIAKKLTGLIFEDENPEIKPNEEIKSADGKNAGRITSVTFSPKLEKTIALAYVRYDYLAEGTELKVGDLTARVKDLPFVGQMS
jgi:folate-binding protein YgfZ